MRIISGESLKLHLYLDYVFMQFTRKVLDGSSLA